MIPIILVKPTPCSIYVCGLSPNDVRIPGMPYDRLKSRGRLPLTPFCAKSVIEAYPDAVIPDNIVRLAHAVDKLPELRKAAEDPLLPVPKSPHDWWPHQKNAFWFFVGLQREGFKGAGLFSELGSGKSKVAVGLADALNVQLGLIIGPKSSRFVWHGQLRTHSERDYHIILPDMRVPIKERYRRVLVRIKQVRKSNPDQPILVMTNYDGVWRPPFGDWALEQNWDLIIADELHRIKGPKSKVSNFMAQLAERTQFRLGLTGTPIHNRPKDVWAQFRFLDPGVFGLDYSEFHRRYGSITGDESADSDLEKEFAEKLYSISFRAKGNLELPPVTKHAITEELVESFEAYKKVEHSIKVGIRRGEITISNALTRLIRLQQITSGFVYDDDHILHVLGHEKENMFDDFMTDFPQNEPLVVFAQFHYDLDIIEAVSQKHGFKYNEYSGPRDEVQAWKLGKSDVLGVQIRAGAESVDLTRARHCLYYSTGLSWGDYRQSVKRVHRAGQKRPVNYIHLVMADTIDEKLYRLLENRGNVIEALLSEYLESER